ncbi:MAG: LLM class flavin-dependent oxidoreductase [Actinomycetota bacterium]
MKVRIGFGLGTNSAVDAQTWWSIVDSCEGLRFDSLWFSERAASDLLDPLTAMAAVAGRTRKLKFGTSVLVVPGRNPVHLAKQLASIDAISNGRLLPAFGLGADLPKEREVTGVARGELPARTEEAVVLMKKLWMHDEVTFEGRFFNVRGVRIGPKPVQAPHPDVWFGGHSEPALSRVARLGEGWLPSFLDPAEYKAKADRIRELAHAAGREIDEEHYGALVVYVPDGADASMVKAAIAKRRPGIDPENVIASNGSDALRSLIEQFIDQGASKFVVVPAISPKAWSDELVRIREAIVTPIQGP